MNRPKTEIPTITDEDSELIEAITSGNTDQFPDLVKKYETRLYNFGLRICKDGPDAEDLVQETFINVFRYLKDFRKETRFKNWMYRIAASVCWKMRRKSKFAPDRELSLEEFMPSDHSKIDTETPDWASQPVTQLLNSELSDKIRASIKSLPPEYKLVLVLRDMEGFSTAETSDILEISAANVKVRLHRARLFLRESLKEYYEDR